MRTADRRVPRGPRIGGNHAWERAATLPPLKPGQIHEVAQRLREAESSVRVLRSIAWPRSAREEFFARGAAELPRVEYPQFNATEVHRQVRAAVALIEGSSPPAEWLRRCAEALDNSADLVASVGTADFLKYGERLYGTPTTELGGATPLGLARSIDALCGELGALDLGAPPPACHLAEGVAAQIGAASERLFGEEAPEVHVVDDLSANALAGPNRILVRRDACFSDRDARQLIEHEAYVHVCTSLNGRHQDLLPILGASHAGTTRTQEGLAVFAEFITGSLDLDRFRRLADRVLAIQRSIDGADFLDVYRFYLERGLTREQAYENARRVFRGGALTGGAPFTKDGVYLDGLLRVTNFLRMLIAERRADCLPLLFCGKLDVEDIPAMAQLTELGMCRPPRFLPPWASDRRFLVAFLSYSTFLDQLRVEAQRQHFRDLLAHTPRVHAQQGAPAEAPGRVSTYDAE